jgi:S1-C subfamily serine protease
MYGGRIHGRDRCHWLGMILLLTLLIGQPQAVHAGDRSAVVGAHCRAASLQGAVACDEPSVLRIKVTLANGDQAQGTGFVVAADASGTYILTNKHVVDGSTAASTTVYAPDGVQHYTVAAIASGQGKTGTPDDLAVIKLPPTTLRPLAWGNAEHLQVGQTVASIGYGLAFDLAGPPSVTEGIVSALHRDLQDGFGPAWIQHQSTINHGNSGGPLISLDGDVVGVNTLSIDQLASSSGNGQEPVQGVFFAIPQTTAQKIAQRLIAQLQHSHSVQTTITTFYATSKANYDAWGATTSAPSPTPVSLFGASTRIVAFYFKYQDATPNVSTYQLVVLDRKGSRYSYGNVHVLKYAADERMISLDNGGPYDQGSFTAELLLNGTVAASTTFSIGAPTSQVRISRFSVATAAAYDAWGPKTKWAPPPPISHLPAGTKAVAFYFRYIGAIPNVSTYQLVLRDHRGAAYFTGKVHPFQQVASDHMSELDNGGAYDPGAYTAELRVNGKKIASVTFTVG